jgi:hypothetical protein
MIYRYWLHWYSDPQGGEVDGGRPMSARDRAEAIAEATSFSGRAPTRRRWATM